MIPLNIPREYKGLVMLLALVLILLALFLGFKSWLTLKEANQVGKPIPYEYTVNVEGIGRAQIKPDIAKIVFSMETKGSTLEEAQQQNSTGTNTLLAKILESGIEKKDIQTTSYSSYEDQRYDDKNGTYKSFGWIISQSITITLRDLEKASTIFELLGQNGVTNISGPDFSVENDQSALQEARVKALSDAQQKANTIAQQLELKLGTPTNYNEWKEEAVPNYGFAMNDGFTEMPTSTSEPNIETGENTVILHVNLSYVIQQ